MRFLIISTISAQLYIQGDESTMETQTARIDDGMSISQIREEIKICERIKREEINRIHRLKAEMEKAFRIISTKDREIKEFNNEIREIELQEMNQQ